MARTEKKQVFTGVVLIVLGLIFLGDQLDLFSFSWTFIMMGVGGAFIVHNALSTPRGSQFVGPLLLFLGFYFFAEEVGWLWSGDSWPWLMVAVGAAFLVNWATDRKNTGVLWPGGILTGLGILFLLIEFSRIRWHDVGEIWEWWPLGMLAVGVWLLVRRDKQGEKKLPPEQEQNPEPRQEKEQEQQ